MPSEESYKEWDEEKYRLLNAHFRQKINVLLSTDDYLSEAVAGGRSLQLQELVGRMSEKDQRLWQEFIWLDRIKLHFDMNDHLEGRGTPYNPRTGFDNPTGKDDDIGEPW